MNETRRKVVLCGDSLVLAALRVGLSAYPSLEITVVAPPSGPAADVLDQIVSINPAAVIFDLAVTCPDCHRALLEHHADRLLLGIDPRSHEVLVLSRQHLAEPSTQDLVALIAGMHSVQPPLEEEASQEEALE